MGWHAVGKPAHERADQCGRRVIAGDTIAFNDLKVPARVRGVGGPLENYLGDAVGEWAVDLIGMCRDPGEIGRAPVHISIPQGWIGVAEEQFVSVGGLGQVASGGVDQALGSAGGPGGVHDKQGGFGVEMFGRVLRAGLFKSVMPPDVPAVRPLNR